MSTKGPKAPVPIGPGVVRQDEMERYIAARNHVASSPDHEAELADQITHILLHNAEVESGIHQAKLRYTRTKRGKKLKVRLSVK